MKLKNYFNVDFHGVSLALRDVYSAGDFWLAADKNGYVSLFCGCDKPVEGGESYYAGGFNYCDHLAFEVDLEGMRWQDTLVYVNEELEVVK